VALITNLQHFLDEHGVIPDEIPGPALKIALFLGSITGWVTINPATRSSETNVPCRRSSGRRRCPGTVFAQLESDGATIAWECPICGDNGIIHGWEGTMWDRSKG
jgi:hypothetical protein